MKKVVSYALFGDGSKYTQYLRALVRAHLNLFPISAGWKMRVAYDDKILSSPTGDLLRAYSWDSLIEIDYRGTAPLCRSMLWRVAPAFDEDVSHVFCRDVDSPPMPRDRIISDQFVQFGGSVGTAHDNVAHIGIMGGLCHFDAKQFREGTGLGSLDELRTWAESSPRRVDWAKHGADQDVLNRLVAESPKLTILEHRYYGWRDGAQHLEGRRDAGVWPHPERAWSTPMPGSPSSTTPIKFGDASPTRWEIHSADRLGAHLGCAGYDHEAAVKFWDTYGDPKIAAQVRKCEESAVSL